MPSFLLLIHENSPVTQSAAWSNYINRLEQSGHLRGGSSLGPCLHPSSTATEASSTGSAMTGYLLVEAENAEDAVALLANNPTSEGHGFIQIRELIED